MTENQWVSRAEAAQMLGVSMRTIGRYMKNGRLLYARDAKTGRVQVRVSTVRDRVLLG